ncbi:hypothetical protein KS4_14500 [Poriferisphaera corsica]|uniref:Uncharacterized protein n=1 Tax=Poriferisphaera corsica TaxID=2528020 RepID=A0A517YT71_9BACT|nr:hypothetical protein [Poriferisphaera corsica]QDU33404.1 hypothetical protein KS4_14500 [Poriferisphaera corsica]
MDWCNIEILQHITSRLTQQRDMDDLEQVVYGFDSWKEIKLHEILEDAFQHSNYGVLREVRYPASWQLKRKNEGQRCDFVLTKNNTPLKDYDLIGTLFSNVIEAADPEDAYWLEVKVVKQFTEGTIHNRYSNDLRRPVPADIAKIWKEQRLSHGGLLLILFTSDRKTAKNDITAWYNQCILLGLPIQYPEIEAFKITDRTGNGYCSIALVQVGA